MKKHLTVLAVLAGSAAVNACDLCAVYNVNAAEGSRNKGFSVSVAEQFTHFGTLQDDGRRVPNRAHEYLDSSISQAVVGYTFNDWASVQLSLPIIHREFRRLEATGVERGTESGIGDLSLLANFTPVRLEHMKWTFNWSVFGGVKFPTGDSDRIKEEVVEHKHEDEGGEEDEEHEGGLHGHDLALGSGSVDGIVGTGFYARYRRGFFTGNMTYSIRTRGDFDYRYGNDVMWSAGPGVFLILEEEWTAAVQFVASGEDKSLDDFHGEKAEDTGIFSVFVGPQVNVTWSDKFSASIGADLPVLRDNTALQLVPDYRLRCAFTWRF